MFEIILYSCGTALLACLVWLLLPSPTFKQASRWLKENEIESLQKWLRYQTIKKSITPRKIAMNIIGHPEFTEQDLQQLNLLFEKLNQPAAGLIVPNFGDRFTPEKMQACNIDTRPHDYYVSHRIDFGVEWRGEVLKPAQVEACSADRLMLYQLNYPANQGNHIASVLVSYLMVQAGPNFYLDAGNLRGFIQQNMMPSDQVTQLFQALVDQHPEHCFQIYWPQAGDPFNIDRMTPAGGAIAGKNTTVKEVLEPGLERKGNPQWCIKARVKI
jgi:hypothetical protein